MPPPPDRPADSAPSPEPPADAEAATARPASPPEASEDDASEDDAVGNAATRPAPPVPTMPDPWAEDGRVRLNRGLERGVHGSPALHFATGFGSLLVGFVAFQVLVSPIVLLALLGLGGHLSAEALGDPGFLERLVQEHTRELILSNTAGQFFGLALVGLLFAWMHTTHVRGLLRLRRPDAGLLGLALGLLVTLQPTVYFLGYLNQQLPLPEGLRLLEEEQMRMIEEVVTGDLSLAFVVATLAVTPGLCEELLFRGYAQRQFERAGGAAFGIVVSGLLFGLYHLRLSQVLPLALLGLLLAYLAWRTGSLWVPIVAHFAHNAVSVVVAQTAGDAPGTGAQEMPVAAEAAPVPWYLVLLSVAASAAVVAALHRRAQRLLAERRADA